MTQGLKQPIKQSSLGRALLLATVVGLAACSDDEVVPPSPLPDYEETITLRKLWSESVGDGVEEYYVSLTPTVTDSHVYAAAIDGTVVKLDRATGEAVWEVETEQPITGGVAAAYGYVVFGTSNGDVVLLKDEDGSQIWKVSTGGQVLSAPALAPERVVVQTIDGRLQGLDIANGARVWLFDTSIPILTLRGESSPMVLGNIALAGFANGKMVALQVADGFVGWEKPIAEPEGRSELERLVDIDGRFDVADTTVFAASFQGRIAALDVPSGRSLWSKAFSSHNGLSVSLESVYATNDDSEIVAMDATSGAEQWKQSKLKGRSVTAPVAYSNYVVAGDFEGYLHWMDRQSGEFVARVKVDGDGLRAPVVIADDVVYVQANDGTLAAYQVEVEEETK